MKIGKYIIAIVLIVLVGYNSVYFKKLDEVKALKSATEFDARQYAQTFWNNKLQPDLVNAVDLKDFSIQLSKDPQKTLDTYSHALGIGNLRYVLVSGKGLITAVNEDNLEVVLDSSGQSLTIATEYIFGNAARDATGLIDINEFTNTMDFNNVSAEINQIIRREVLPNLKSGAGKGKSIEFVGAIELNREHLNLSKIELIPVKVSISDSN